jgi:hypothetical protein
MSTVATRAPVMHPSVVGEVVDMAFLASDDEARGNQGLRTVRAVVEIRVCEVTVSCEAMTDGTRLEARKTNDGHVRTVFRRRRLNEARHSHLPFEPGFMEIRAAHVPTVECCDHEGLIGYRHNRTDAERSDELASPDAPFGLRHQIRTR